MFVKLDYESIQQFEERIREISKDLRNRFFRECTQRLGLETWKEAANRSPVKKGYLKRSWGITSVVQNGDVWQIDVINPAEYAIYVEEGHRQEVGRYVNAIGKRLVTPFVEGQHMLRGSIEEKIAPQTTEFLEGKLRELFGG